MEDQSTQPVQPIPPPAGGPAMAGKPATPTPPVEKPMNAIFIIILTGVVILGILIFTKRLAQQQPTSTPTPTSVPTPSASRRSSQEGSGQASPTPSTQEQNDVQNVEIQDIEPTLQDMQNDLDKL